MKRIVSVVTLTALINLMLGGCTKTVTVSLYESGHLRHNAITGVVMKTGEQATFNERGGQFNAGRSAVTGVTADDDSSCYRLDDLSSVKTIARVSGLMMSCDIPSCVFPAYFKNPKPGKITSVLARDGLRHEFDSRGGSIDVAAGTISGYNRFKTPFSVALDDVDLVGVKKPDRLANTLLIVGVTGAITVGLVALIIHDLVEPFPGGFSPEF